MNPRSFQIPLEQSTSVSINIIHETINNNSEELEKIKKLVDENKKNGHKIPLIATVLLLFHNAENNTLKKSDLYSLMEKETKNNKNAIISSPTERYCIINHKNYKSKIKDILKKKKWFTKKLNENKEIEYTLNPGVVSSIVPRITSFFKVLAKNDYLFINEEKEEKEEKESEKEKEEEKKEKEEKQEKKMKKGKKGRKPKKAKQENLEAEETEEKKEKQLPEEKKTTLEKQVEEEKQVTVEIQLPKEKQETDEKQVTEENHEVQKEEENNENIPERNNDDNENIPKGNIDNNEKVIYKEDTKKNNNSAINIKKEKDIQEKEEIIGDFEIIIEDDDDDENNNNISFIKTEERIIIPNIEDQKNENNDNSTDLVPIYLNKKRKPKKKKINKKSTNENQTEKEEEIFSSINNNINPSVEENLNIANPEINKGKTHNNKIDSIINFGELFLKLLKSKKLSELASKKIDSINEGIKNKEKEIQYDAKFVEKIIQKDKDVNSVNIKEIDNKIKEIKKINEDCKEKNRILPTGNNACQNGETEEEKIHGDNNFNENAEINNKMISDFSLIFNNYKTAGELLNMILIGETRENNSDMKFINIDNIPIEGNENVPEKIFSKTKTDIKVIKYDNHSDGKFIDLFKEESPNKKNCENMLDVEDASQKKNL